MKSKIFFIFVICSSLFSICEAQPILEWAKRYNFQDGFDQAIAIGIDNAGNSYVTGYSNGAIATVKYSPNGTQLWNPPPRYTPAAYFDNFGYSIAVYTDGLSQTFIYVTSYVQTTNQGYDFVTIKYNSDGTYAWNPPGKIYNGPGNGNDVARHIEVDAGGNTYVTGYSLGSGTGNDFATIKYNSSGIEQWVARYNRSGGNDMANCLKLDLNGNIFVNGVTQSGANPYLTTIAYNNTGAQLWVAIYNSPLGDFGVDNGNTIAVRTNYGVYVTSHNNPGGNTAQTVKYNPMNGQQIWAIDNPGFRNNSIGIFQKHCGGNIPCFTIDVYVTGMAAPANGQPVNGQTIKYQDNGDNVELKWTAICNTGGLVEFSQLAIDPNENVYVTGGEEVSIGFINYITVKYEPVNGNQQWLTKYGGNQTQSYASDIRVDGNGNIYITGGSDDVSGSGRDYLTIKYHEGGYQNYPILQNEQNTLSNIPGSFALRQNYPNPFNPSTEIKYDLPKDVFVIIKVYNMLGEEVAVLVNNEFRTAGRYSIIFNGTKLASGIYIYKLVVSEANLTNSIKFENTKKMVLVK